MKTIKLVSSMLFVAAMAMSTVSFGQVKIGTNPTTIDAANNLEIEASTAGNKVSVDKTTGKVRIADGSQAAESILTSDANGVATWQPKANIRLEETVFIGEQSGTYLTTTFDGTFNSPKDRVPLNVRAGSLPGYNATTKMYTIQESGYYRIFTGARGEGTLTPAQITNGTTWTLYMHPFSVLQQYQNISTGTGPVLSTFWQAYLEAGTEIALYTISQGQNQNVKVSQGFLSISKIF